MTLKTENIDFEVAESSLRMLMDYCLENKVSFTASPADDEGKWHLMLQLENIMSALALGMFLNETGISPNGIELKKKLENIESKPIELIVPQMEMQNRVEEIIENKVEVVADSIRFEPEIEKEEEIIAEIPALEISSNLVENSKIELQLEAEPEAEIEIAKEPAKIELEIVNEQPPLFEPAFEDKNHNGNGHADDIIFADDDTFESAADIFSSGKQSPKREAELLFDHSDGSLN